MYYFFNSENKGINFYFFFEIIKNNFKIKLLLYFFITSHTGHFYKNIICYTY